MIGEGSVSVAHLGQVVVGVHHQNKPSSVSGESGNATRNDTSVDSSDTMELDNVAHFLSESLSKLISVAFSLELVLHEFEGPDNPPSGGRHKASGEELPCFSV
jgi:hypothetical protein